MDESGSVAPSVAAGESALAQGRWQAARARFQEALAQADSPAAAEGLSWACWWLEDVPACLQARERAYRGYLEQGDPRGAARMALWLSDDHVEFRGARAVADGWAQRSARLLADLEPGAEHGWLDVFRANAVLADQDHAEAIRLARRARDLGHRLGVVDLAMFSLATEGVALVAHGEVAEGMRLLDEATVAAVAGEYENLAPAAWTCCHLISTCELVRDYDRGAQWCQEVTEFSRRLQARFVTGVCRAHYAAILTWRGDWHEAERELLAAIETLRAHRPAWAPEAVVRLGELRRRQGRFADAEELFGQHPEHPLALLGLAELRLHHGDPDTAADLLTRQLRRLPERDVAGRAGAVEALVRVELARGRVEPAQRHLDELRTIAATVGVLPLRAQVRHAEGLLAAARGDQTACDHFEDAADLFGRAGARLDVGRSRLELSRALGASGRGDASAREAQAAQELFADMGAVAFAEQAATARDRVRRTAVAGVLTARQLEVLRLVADGLGDREIAGRLVLSEHTVHRHIANIYARLGCSSRATAVAHASRRGLL